MKKLILSAFAALAAFSANAATWAVVGAYTDPSWDFGASTKFTGEGDELSCTIDHLTNGFKIVEISNNNWDTQYGTATPIEINKEYVLDAKNGGPDPANITFDGLVQAINNATVKWNPSTATLEIVAQESDLEIAYPTLYLTGSFCDWSAPGEGASVLGVEKDGLYTFTVNLGDSGNVEFKLAGTGWSNEIAGDVTVTAEEAVVVTKGGNNLKTTLTGEQTLTFNYTTMTMTFGDPSLTDKTPDRTWAVVGSYTTPNWDFDASIKFIKGSGGELTCTISKLTNDFKIVDITNNNWDTAYGLDSPIEVNTSIKLELGQGNIKFSGLIQEVNNATVKWDPTTATMEIIADENDVVIAYPDLYLTGNIWGSQWPAPGEGSSIKATEKNGIYTVTADLGTSGDIQFKLAGPGWSNEIAGGVTITNDAATTVTMGGDNLWTSLTGEQTLTFNYNTMKMTFGSPYFVGAYPDGYFLVGDMTEPYDGGFVPNPSYKFTENDDDYTLNVASMKMADNFYVVEVKDYVVTAYSASGFTGEGAMKPVKIGDVEQQDPSDVTLSEGSDEMNINNNYVNLTFTLTVGDSTSLQFSAEGIDGKAWSITPGNDQTNQSGTVTPTENGANIDFLTVSDVALAYIFVPESVTEVWYTLTATDAEATNLNALAGEVPVKANVSDGYFTVALAAGKTGTIAVYTSQENATAGTNAAATFTYTVKKGVPTAVEGIEAAEDASVEYYNLQGVRVANPEHGIFIVKKAGKTAKVIL